MAKEIIEDKMSQDLISIRVVEDLINNLSFISQGMKTVLLQTIKFEVNNSTDINREELLRNMYNIYAIAAKFQSEAIFRCGRINFRDDNELLFDTIIGTNSKETEIILFQGCTIAKGDGSSYILIHNVSAPDHIQKMCKTFDFNRLVKAAITPAEMTVIMNVGYYPAQMESILRILK